MDINESLLFTINHVTKAHITYLFATNIFTHERRRNYLRHTFSDQINKYRVFYSMWPKCYKIITIRTPTSSQLIYNKV